MGDSCGTMRFAALCFCLLLVAAAAQMDGMKKKEYKPFKTALPHIRCGVCKELVASLHTQVAALPEHQPKGKVASRGKLKGRISEADVEEVIAHVCDPKEESGRWTSSIDIVSDHPHVVLQPTAGQCKRECQTVVKSCERLIDDLDDTDTLQVQLWKGITLSQLESKLCTEWTNACTKKSPKKSFNPETAAEVFNPKSQKDIEMEEMMAKMKGMGGMGGMSMFNADDIAGMSDEPGSNDDDL